MAEVAEKLLTFEEFAKRNTEGRYELVNGRLEELVAPRPFHNWTCNALAAELHPYLLRHDLKGFWGTEFDFPTLPLHGRRPDFAYFSAADTARGLDLEQNRTYGIPTLAVEVVSEEDEARDRITKRKEYAQVGVPHYWIIDPQRKNALTLVLQNGEYVESGTFSGEDAITSSLFPGLEIPLSHLFR